MAGLDQQWLVALGLGFILFLGFSGKKSEPEPELDQLKQDAMALVNVWNTVILGILQYTGMKSSLEAWREVDNDKNHEKLMRFTEFCRQWLARAETAWREVGTYGPTTYFSAMILSYLREIDGFYNHFDQFKVEQPWQRQDDPADEWFRDEPKMEVDRGELSFHKAKMEAKWKDVVAKEEYMKNVPEVPHDHPSGWNFQPNPRVSAISQPDGGWSDDSHFPDVQYLGQFGAGVPKKCFPPLRGLI